MAHVMLAALGLMLSATFAETKALALQIHLDRAGFSCSAIDGVWGRKSERALAVYLQERRRTQPDLPAGFPSPGAALDALFASAPDPFRIETVTQADIDALGNDTAATDKLYECFLLNCSITAANPGGALSITGFAVSNDVVSVTVQLVRQSPLGYINGALYLYGANDLSVGFGGRPISNEIVDFRDGDSIFDTLPASGLVTQTVTATFDASLVSEKFFKAKIEFPRSDEPDEPWEPDPEEVEE